MSTAQHEVAKEDPIARVWFYAEAANRMVRLNAFRSDVKDDINVRGVKDGPGMRDYFGIIIGELKDPKDASRFVIEEDRYLKASLKDPKLREEWAKNRGSFDNLETFDEALTTHWRAMGRAAELSSKAFCGNRVRANW